MNKSTQPLYPYNRYIPNPYAGASREENLKLDPKGDQEQSRDQKMSKVPQDIWIPTLMSEQLGGRGLGTL